MDKFERTGVWWTEDNHPDDGSQSDDTVAGTLSYNPATGGTLELIGAFTELREYPDPQNIYGVTTEGEHVTLPQSNWNGESTHTKATTFHTERYHISQIYIGGFVTDDYQFKTVKFSFPKLERWADTPTAGIPDEEETTPGLALSKTATLDDAEVTLKADESPEQISIWPLERARLIVSVDEPVSFTRIHDKYIKPIQNLITLCYGEPVFPKSITAYTEQDTTQNSRHKVYTENKYYQETDPEPMFLYLSDLDFQYAVEHWINSSNDVAEFHDRYFSRLYNQETRLQNEFIDLIVGLEMYHRETYPSGTYSDNIVWDHVRDSMLERLPDIQAKDRIEDLVNSIGNEYSLGDRLRDINDDHSEVYAHLFDPGSARSDAVGARIDLAHGLDQEDMDMQELHRRKQQVEIMSTACLYNILDVDLEEAQDVVGRLYHYRRDGE